MELSLFFAFASAIIYLVGFVPYIYHVYHGHVIPHPLSWTTWGVISLLNTLALVQDGGFSEGLVAPILRTLCLIIGATIGWTLIRQVSLNRYDYFCIALAVATLIGTYFFGLQNAVIFTIFIDILVLFPTLKKIWLDPTTEDAFAWVTTTLSQFFLLLALGVSHFSEALFWSYLMLMNGSVAVFIWMRSQYITSWTYKFEKIREYFALKNKL